MSRHIHRTADVTIPNGGTDSPPIKSNEGRIVFGDSYAISFFAPATLPEAITIQVSYLNEPTGSDWSTLQSGGSDISIAAGKCTVVANPVFLAMRLHAGGAVAADRVFRLLSHIEAQ